MRKSVKCLIGTQLGKSKALTLRLVFNALKTFKDRTKKMND